MGGSRWLMMFGLSCVACLGSGGGGGGSSCEPGSEGCACFGNNTCLDELACRSKLCVDVSSTDDDTDSDDTDAGASDDDDENPTDTETDDDTSTDSATDRDQATDDDSPTDDAPTDDSNDTDEDDPASTDSDASDATDDDDDVETDTGATDVQSTDDDTATDPEPAMTDDDPEPECEGSGSCAAGNATTCQDGQLIEADCSACALLSCGLACCESVWPLVADAYPYQQRDDLLTSFTTNGTAATVVASFDGDGEQFAAIGFSLDAPVVVDPNEVYFEAATSGAVAVEVSLDRDDTTGCQFETAYDGVIGDTRVLTEELFCWGDWMETGYGGTVRKILVRVISFATAQSAALEVYSVGY